MGLFKSLKVIGEEYKKIYRSDLSKVKEGKKGEDGRSTHQRHFCGHCGSFLYAYDETWADYVYPFHSAIDTPLPRVPVEDQVHIMLDFKLPHVQVPAGVPKEQQFARYPDKSIEQYHKEKGWYGTYKPPGEPE